MSEHPFALSTQNIPNNFPCVPVIPITGNPLFPKFVKMIEVCLPPLLLGRKALQLLISLCFFPKDHRPTPYGCHSTQNEVQPPLRWRFPEKESKRVSRLLPHKVFSSQTNILSSFYLSTEDVVKSVDDLYRTGTFVQIPEWDDMGNKIRMLVIGHRR